MVQKALSMAWSIWFSWVPWIGGGASRIRRRGAGLEGGLGKGGPGGSMKV